MGSRGTIPARFNPLFPASARFFPSVQSRRDLWEASAEEREVGMKTQTGPAEPGRLNTPPRATSSVETPVNILYSLVGKI